MTKVTLPENCKFAQAKLLIPVVFASVSPSIRSADIKLREVIKLLSQLPNISKTNGDHKDEKFKAIQTIADGMKIRKKILLSNMVLAVNRRIWLNLMRTPTFTSLGRN